MIAFLKTLRNRERTIPLTRKMRQHAEEVFTLRDIKLRFTAPDAAQDQKCDVNVRRDLYLIFKTPHLYTNNKLTLAEGFTPPKDAPSTLDIMRLSVGTDPGLALGTRKGIGYYKGRGVTK